MIRDLGIARLPSEHPAAVRFRRRVLDLPPGTNAIYHEGYLACNRAGFWSVYAVAPDPLMDSDTIACAAVAEAAYTLAKLGKGHLLQERVEDFHYIYMFRRT